MRFKLAAWLVAGGALLAAGCGGGNPEPLMQADGEVNLADADVGDRGGDVGAEGPEVDGALPDKVGPEVPGEGVKDAFEQEDAGVDGGADLAEAEVLPALCSAATDVWLDAMCEGFCKKIDVFNLETVFAGPEECPGMCREVLDEHPDWLANFMCVAGMDAAYLLGYCWWPKPLLTVAGCDAWCEAMHECDLEWVLGIPDDDCLCEAACTGFYSMTGSIASTVAPCAAEVIKEKCDLEATGKCYDVPFNCEQTCQQLQFQCQPGQSLEPLFANEEECVELCQGSTQGQMYALQMCLAIDGCKSPELCAELPEEPAAGCGEYCEAYHDLCEFSSFPPELCPWVCTAALQALPGADPDQGLACLGEQETCPLPDPDSLLVTCLVGKCTLMCGTAAGQCEEESAYFILFPSADGCMQTCDAFEQFAAMAAGMCMLVGGCDHPEACLNPPAEPAAGCEGWCDALLDVCPGLPWPDATTCAPLCTGVKMQVPAADPVGGQECLALLDQCPATPEEAVFGCLAAKCGLMCGLYGSCEPDSVYIETFGTFEECTEYCGTLSFGEGVAAGYCAMFAGCDNADKCMPPAEEAPEGCDTWCEVIEQLCPGNELVMPSLCLDACAGLSMVLPGAEPGLAEECLDEYDECPEEAGKVVYGCMVEEEPECVDVCADLDACGLTTDWLCAIFCTGLEQDDPSVHDLFVGCVQAADECDQMKPCVGQ